MLECFTRRSENTRHGACQRWLSWPDAATLPERLPDAVPHVAEARRTTCGAATLGGRARAQPPRRLLGVCPRVRARALAPHAPALGPALLVAACFDREVNCRRAAAAAFQEAVGRLGAFPHGMDVVSAADYFALGARANAFTRVADFVCALDEYRPALLEHLLRVKLAHWERPTRELAARALGWWAGGTETGRATALPALLDRALSPALETRHGAWSAPPRRSWRLRPRSGSGDAGRVRRRRGRRARRARGDPGPGRGRRVCTGARVARPCARRRAASWSAWR